MKHIQSSTEGKWAKTTCPYCGVGCGVLAKISPEGNAEIKGDPDHPSNYGRLCSKGTNLGETLSLNDRLLSPTIDGKDVSWDHALSTISSRFSEILKTEGPDAIAMYVSGQFLTEDYYVANKFMKGFIGSANIDTNSRLCMASTVAGHKRAFGADTVPNCFEDLELADVIVLVGSNLAWCHPILFQRIEAERQKRPSLKLVCIDPRTTMTAEASDLHLSLKPGSDVALFNGLLNHIEKKGHVDQQFIESHIEGFDKCLEQAKQLSDSEIEKITDLNNSELNQFYELFSTRDRVMTLFSQGVNQSTSGTDKVNAILNCHLATGRIGKPGSGPLSLTGQPNAMGGREVGGLANQLACHMELSNENHHDLVSRFWDAPKLAKKAGLKAVELFKAVDGGKIKAIWIMATNPVDSMPEADLVKQALKKCSLVIVSDISRETDTVELADIILPSTAWGEKSGTVTNSERRISHQQPFTLSPGKARHDWWQISEVAKRMGFQDQFPYETAYEIFTEYAALSAFENEGERDFNIGALSTLTKESYENFKPIQWPCFEQSDRKMKETKRLFAKGEFFTDSKMAQMIATPFKKPQSVTSKTYPLVLNTGRIRDQWHTMTRTAKSTKLMRHIGEPFVEINPEEAKKYDIKDAEIVKLTSVQGSVLMRARLTEAVVKGNLFTPFHWTDRNASNARIDALVAANTDPISGQPESKHTAVQITPLKPKGYGFILSRFKPDRERLRKITSETKFYWSLIPVENGWLLECAGDQLQQAGNELLSALLGFECEPHTTFNEVLDPEIGLARRAYFTADRLEGFISIAPSPVSASRGFVTSTLSNKFNEQSQKISLLYGRPPPTMPDKGSIICSCFNIGANEIKDAVKKHSCSDVKKIGDFLKAGTNCGSCKSEIKKIINEPRFQAE